MGQVSRTLAARFSTAARDLNPLRAEARQIREAGKTPQDLPRVEQSVGSGLDPLHTAYTAVQNFTSLFAEAMSAFDELDSYVQILGDAQEEYLPGFPPVSPLTHSYFTTWAFFDVRFGPDLETIGTCLLDTRLDLGMDETMRAAARSLQESRMGIYEHVGLAGGRCRLKELITGNLFDCHVPAGYLGRAGELWYVRLCPPLLGLVDYHVAFRTPYVLLNASTADWTRYLKRATVGARSPATALHEFLKFGPDPNHWNEFVLRGYHHHESNVIFLAGLPDVKDSLPHASEPGEG